MTEKKDKQAEAMEKQLTKLVKKNGAATPTALIEASRAVNSITHDCFEWDDEKAGDEYRLIQARRWIRTIRVIIPDQDDQEMKVRLVHVPPISGRGEGEYKPISIIVESPSEYERALNAAIRDLEAAQDRVEELKRAADELGDKDRVAVLAALTTTLMTARDILQKLQ